MQFETQKLSSVFSCICTLHFTYLHLQGRHDTVRESTSCLYVTLYIASFAMIIQHCMMMVVTYVLYCSTSCEICCQVKSKSHYDRQ
jgi:hypothetical protein